MDLPNRVGTVEKRRPIKGSKFYIVKIKAGSEKDWLGAVHAVVDDNFDFAGLYRCNTNKVFHSASKAEDVFRVLLVLKLVLQLGSLVSLLVHEPL
ncbi:hypothetical protein Tco_0271779 [Tanacetum coccineum]